MVEIAALCWPTLLNHAEPMIFPDTRSYYVAGRATILKAIEMLHRPAAVAGNAGLDHAIQQARAVRSVFYSVITYLSAATLSPWLAIAVQASIVIFSLRLTLQVFFPEWPARRRTLFILALALATSISWVVSTAMPDVFTPVAILVTLIVILFWGRLDLARRWTSIIVIASSALMHLTTPLIIIGLLAIAALLRLRRLRVEWRQFTLVVCAVGFALVATLAVSVIGFKQWTLAPNQPPFLLARSIDDGPGKLYLLEHCPQIGLDMCHHLDRLDVGSDDFIWHDNGVYSTVPLDEAAQLRAEDKRIFIAAAWEHPWLQIIASGKNVLSQLVNFDLSEFFIPSYGYVAGYESPDMTMYIRPTQPGWQKLLAFPEYCVVLVALFYAARAWAGGALPREEHDFLILILAAVVLDAMVTGVFSIPSPRYEARVIWLIPMTAMLTYLIQCAPTARFTSGERIHPGSCR
jgi:hypothetical protein